MDLLRHEKFPEICSGYSVGGNCLAVEWKKNNLHTRYQQAISEFPDSWRCVSHRFNGKFTLNLCDAQVFKTKNSEISC